MVIGVPTLVLRLQPLSPTLLTLHRLVGPGLVGRTSPGVGRGACESRLPTRLTRPSQTRVLFKARMNLFMFRLYLPVTTRAKSVQSVTPNGMFKKTLVSCRHSR